MRQNTLRELGRPLSTLLRHEIRVSYPLLAIWHVMYVTRRRTAFSKEQNAKEIVVFSSYFVIEINRLQKRAE